MDPGFHEGGADPMVVGAPSYDMATFRKLACKTKEFACLGAHAAPAPGSANETVSGTCISMDHICKVDMGTSFAFYHISSNDKLSMKNC